MERLNSGCEFFLKRLRGLYNKYFKNKNWNYFNADEQLIFDNETLYWIKY